MKYAVLYDSKTGNTKALGQIVSNNLEDYNITYYGNVEGCEKEADIYFIGFWTDKGSCSETLQTFLKTLHQKKIALFGTAGFGGSEGYFNSILDRVKTNIAEDNEILGTFMCQGKMPMSVRKRYEAMAEKNPSDQKAMQFLDNFDKALSHPDDQDYEHLKVFIKNILKEIEIKG